MKLLLLLQSTRHQPLPLLQPMKLLLPSRSIKLLLLRQSTWLLPQHLLLFHLTCLRQPPPSQSQLTPPQLRLRHRFQPVTVASEVFNLNVEYLILQYTESLSSSASASFGCSHTIHLIPPYLDEWNFSTIHLIFKLEMGWFLIELLKDKVFTSNETT